MQQKLKTYQAVTQRKKADQMALVTARSHRTAYAHIRKLEDLTRITKDVHALVTNAISD